MRRPAIAILLGVLVLAACAGGGTDPASLEGTIWNLVEIDGEAVPEGSTPTLEFGEANEVSGMGGCNRFTGGVELGEGTITLGPLASTRMACPDEAITELETAYLLALEGAETWSTDGDTLVIEGSAELTFEAA
jgi:heat shock protein HslJ